MPTLGFVIDNRKCIGCHACTVACKSEHDVPIGVDRTWVKYIEKGSFPNNRRMFSVMRCNHCEWSPCTTICPVTALYRRSDGVVDFNSDRCIGCKACMHACPYDALFIDPESNTAAKCNFCTHRLEVGLEPSCVVVCPEQAIIAGDLDDPMSEIAQLIDGHPVQVRKPEKGTRPKLYYIDGDESSLNPTRTETADQYVWSLSGDETKPAVPSNPAQPRRSYDVPARKPSWGWPVAAYTWTKSLATGPALAGALSIIVHGSVDRALQVTLALVALLFLGITCGLLVADLKQPKRFLYVILRPQWQSWLVRGAYVLMVYGILATVWLLAAGLGWSGVVAALMWPTVVFAGLGAVYTALLFAQAKGRDFWQNPLLSVHLLGHAMVCGSAVWLMAAMALGRPVGVPQWFLIGSLSANLLILLAEMSTAHGTEDARRVMHMIVAGPYRVPFWAGGILAGHVVPLMLLSNGSTSLSVLACLVSLAGLLVVEFLWVLTPQRIPLS